MTWALVLLFAALAGFFSYSSRHYLKEAERRREVGAVHALAYFLLKLELMQLRDSKVDLEAYLPEHEYYRGYAQAVDNFTGELGLILANEPERTNKAVRAVSNRGTIHVS